MPGLRRRWLVAIIAVAMVAIAMALFVGTGQWGWGRPDATQSGTAFVGSAECATCHAAEGSAWQSSQHAVAMQEAAPGTVLGRFDSTRVTVDGSTSIFFRRGDRYFVNTEGGDGAPHDFEVDYTFGVSPLQQYIVAFGGGRMQALSLAWDTRPASAGGQRWFSLNPGRRTTHTDEEHWTGRLYNWNFRCADCHSTAVRKEYDAETDRFQTTRSEISVGCEACHGPGAEHVEWAKTTRWLRGIMWRDNGLSARLAEHRDVRWVRAPEAPTAHRSVPRATDGEIDTCAQCHARRIHIADGYTAGAPLTDYYIPSLLEGDLYYPDGQQREEVYTYGSFLQSRMYQAGVTCADCHDPHTQRLRAPGNQVCAQCHSVARYDTTAHHFHSRGSQGANCASCHMPTTTYMRIDPRHDHSIRVPRPDLSVALGVPNACTQCHTDRDARWADQQARAWYGRPPTGFQQFAAAFAASEQGDPAAADSLIAVVNESTQSAIVRASALARLVNYPGPKAFQSADRWSRDDNVLVRLAAMQILDAFPANARVRVATPLLRDDRRAVRQGAAWLLAPIADSLPTASRRAFAAAAAEFVASQRYNADQPDHRMSLGHFYAQRGKLDSASAEYEAALRLAPRFAQAYVDLAAVQRAQGTEEDAERTLRRGVAMRPDDAGMHYALGQHLLAVGRPADAIAPLRRAAEQLPDVVEFGYAHAIALHGTGRVREAIRVLRSLRARYPDHADVQAALETFERESEG